MTDNQIWNNYLAKGKYDSVLTKFIDEVELSNLIKLLGNEYEYIINGGYDNAERVRLLINPNEDMDFEISPLKIIYPHKFVTLNHRNVLGTIISLGINRSAIGDIIISSDESHAIYVLVVREMVGYLLTNLTSINNYPIQIKEVNIEELKNIKVKEAFEREYIISSLRVDVILASVLNVSRNEINNYFEEKKVLINHQICLNRHYEYKPGDLISVRKFGRILLDDQIRRTKKNNCVVKIKIWR